MPWLECANAQSDLAFAVRICPESIFSYIHGAYQLRQQNDSEHSEAKINPFIPRFQKHSSIFEFEHSHSCKQGVIQNWNTKRQIV